MHPQHNMGLTGGPTVEVLAARLAAPISELNTPDKQITFLFQVGARSTASAKN